MSIQRTPSGYRTSNAARSRIMPVTSVGLKGLRKSAFSSLLAAAVFLLAAAGMLFAGESRAADDTLSSGNKNRLMLYGIVTRALLFADDGDRHELFQIDGSVENTRIGWIFEGRLSEDVGIRGQVEMDTPLSNAPGDINLTGTESAEVPWAIRIQDVAVAHKRFGRITLGQGDTASTDRVVIDLSGTDLAAGNNPADMAGGIHFYNKTTGARTVTIGELFDKVDGIDKNDRLRYDLPEIIDGVNLGVSYVAGGDWDVGGGYAAEFGGFELEMAAFYANVSAGTTDQQDMWGGAGSIKHKSGLSFTIAGAVKSMKALNTDNPDYIWGKIGYSAGLFDVGETHFGLSYGQYNDFAQNGDEATSLGFGVVQDLEPIGSNLWLLVRNHELDRTGSDRFDDIFIVSAGSLFNF